MESEASGFLAGIVFLAFALFMATKAGVATIKFHKRAKETSTGSGGTPSGDKPAKLPK